MLKTLYEHEKSNNIIYDGLREYCVTEKVNEEYLRACDRIYDNGRFWCHPCSVSACQSNCNKKLS